jgi:DNA topoisomerase-1
MDIVRIGNWTKTEKQNKPFTYNYIKKNIQITDVNILAQIKTLHIPPAWIDVHISSNPKTKIQAYGLDSKGRKQVIYAKWFIQQNKSTKYKKIMELEPLVQQIKHDIHAILTTLANKNKTATDEIQIALILHIMMLCNFRIGNDVDTGGKLKAYGLTTLQWNHVRFAKESKTVYFEFVGKKGVINKAECSDSFVYNILQNMKKIHNKNKETNNNANIFSVTSTHVNTFLRNYDANITSKDIRTWMANELYIKYFFKNPEDETKFEKRQRNALAHVATQLHNTAAVCKTSYIFPEFLEI